MSNITFDMNDDDESERKQIHSTIESDPMYRIYNQDIKSMSVLLTITYHTVP